MLVATLKNSLCKCKYFGGSRWLIPLVWRSCRRQKTGHGHKSSIHSCTKIKSNYSFFSRNPKKKWKIRPLTVVMIITSTFLLLVGLFCIWMRKYRRKGGMHKSQVPEEKNLELPCFDIVTIEKATQSFSDLNKIGEGGFGPVYKVLHTGGKFGGLSSGYSVSGGLPGVGLSVGNELSEGG